jgi:hypothetical protein
MDGEAHAGVPVFVLAHADYAPPCPNKAQGKDIALP